MKENKSDKVMHALRWCSVAAMAFSGAALAGPNGPACSAGLGTTTHGEHIIGDYVTGLGGVSGDMGWPPNGKVGQAVQGNGGALVPGGPGPGFHFANGFAPGASASFCNANAHPNGFDIPGPFVED